VPTLRFHRGQELLFEHRLASGRTSIGRADSCDIAVPGETVSRTHLLVQGRGDRWRARDRSKHGVRVDGAPAPKDDWVDLVDGTALEVGEWRITFALGDREAQPTANAVAPRTHEIVHAMEPGRVVAERAWLVVVDGPGKGRRVPLDRSPISVGGAGSGVVLAGDGLEKDHCWLRIARGRVMVAPGQAAAMLDGDRVREITPLLADEELQLGDSVVRVERRIEEDAPTAERFGDLVGQDASMQRLFGQLRRMAAHHYTVLVIGESGTGKELIARALHDHSPRAERPFVALNCGAISETLFESELFGHEKGAFTGADRRRDGAFHEAEGGTLFLDEVGELPEAAQAKLLRALETGEVRRVGSTKASTPDVRIVAATNRDLPKEVAAGRFREDLFFRLAVLSVDVPPLRQRKGDLGALCARLCAALGGRVRVTEEALEVLEQHDWPGNVRELRNVLTRAFVLGGPRIDVEHLSFHRIHPGHGPSHAGAVGASIEAQEKAFILAALSRHGDNRSAAARELGVARSTLHYKMKKFGIA
jgi:DNA-binding NtrC family response regulator